MEDCRIRLGCVATHAVPQLTFAGDSGLMTSLVWTTVQYLHEEAVQFEIPCKIGMQAQLSAAEILPPAIYKEVLSPPIIPLLPIKYYTE